MKINIGKYPKDPNKERKFEIRIDPYDVWDFDSLASVILAWLIKFREEEKHGYPAFLLKDCGSERELYSGQLCFDFYSKTDPSSQELTQQWLNIIDKMIWSFNEVVNEPNALCFYDQVGEIDWDDTKSNPNEDGTYTMRWKVEPILNRFKLTQYEERIQEGLDLFAKYFRNLWD